MIDPSKEAAEYAKIKPTLSLTTTQKIEIAYVAGTNSKYVQAKILQAQIDVLQTLILGNNNDNTAIIFKIKIKIFELQQQLKQLENE